MSSEKFELDGQFIEKKALKYEGKAKQVFATNNADVLWVHYMDQVTALNGKLKEDFPEKGHFNNLISNLLFDYLTQSGIANHWLANISETDQLVKRVDIIPIEVVTRNYASGHFVSRFDVKPMMPLTPTVQEFYYKSDALDDPFMNDSQILALRLATKEELTDLRIYARQVNEKLVALFKNIGITLVDFKLEFGRTADHQILLADEISPDTMRLVDQSTGESLDKDVFRKHQGDLRVGYQEVLNRLEQFLNQ